MNVCTTCECVDKCELFNYNNIVNTSLIYNSCSVFGHRKIEITKELEYKLVATFEDLIKQGCKNFYFGGFGEFDDLCHKVISELKNIYPCVQRIFCLADPRHQRISKRPKWLKDEDYEKFIYLDLDFDWWYQRIYYRNCAIIDLSDYIVFYVIKTNNSGANKALEYAIKKKKTFKNIAQIKE